MGLPTDEGVSSTIQLILPVETLKKCCCLDNGQNLHMNAAGHMKECEAELVKIHMKRFDQNIQLQIEAPSLQKLLTDKCYVICYATGHHATECESTTSKYNMPCNLQDELNLKLVDESIHGIPESKKNISGHCDKKDTLKPEGNETCGQVVNHILMGKETEERNGKAVVRVVTRSMTKTWHKSLQSRIKGSQRSSLKYRGRLLKKNIMKLSSQQAACEIDASEKSVDVNSNTHEARVEASLNTDSGNKSCGRTVKCLTDNQQVGNLCKADVFCREADSEHKIVTAGYSEPNVEHGNCMDTKLKMLDVRDDKNQILTEENSPSCSEFACTSYDTVSKSGCNAGELELENALNGQPGSCIESKHKSLDTKKKSALCKSGKKRSRSKDNLNICDNCSKSFKSLWQLNRHKVIKHATRECMDISPSAESDSEVLEQKSKLDTQTDQSVLCPKCGKCFKTHRAVSSHLGSAHSKEWPFKCERCERVFRLQRKLDSHHCTSKTKVSQQNSAGSNRDGLQDDKNLVPCPLCNVAKINYNTLYKHLLSHHKQHPRYKDELTKLKPLMRVQCDRCGLDFSTSTNLRKHMKLRKCTDEQSSGIKSGKPCPFCAKISASITHLAQHMRLMHRQHPRYAEEERKLHAILTIQCEICGNWYPDKESWRQHYTNAHAEDRHRCPYCRKPFRLKSNMQVHINHRHLGLPYKKSTRRYFRTCKRCPRSFLSKEELEEHTKAEHGTKRQVHQCDKCSFMYSETREYFLHHRKVHSHNGIKCPCCSASFTSVWFLKKHMKQCPKTNGRSEPGNGSQSHGDVHGTESENVSNAAGQHLEANDNAQKAEPECRPDGESLVSIIPVITTGAVDSCSGDSKEVICNSLLLSNVFDDCMVTDGTVQVSQVTEVTVDGTSQAMEEVMVAGYSESIQVMEDSVATNERVIYIPAGSSLDVSQLPLGTIVETADGTAYWNGT